MAVAQRGTATTDVASGTGSATVSKPTGVASGDLLVAKCTTYDSSTQTVTSSGWTLLGEVRPGGFQSTNVHVLYRVADGSEGASFTFAEGTAYYLVIELTAWSGADSGAPTLGTFVTGANGSGAGAKTFTGITMPAPGVLLALASGYGAGWGTPSGYTAYVSNLDGTCSTYGKAVSSGATSNQSVSTTGTTSFAGVLVGIAEAGGGGSFDPPDLPRGYAVSPQARQILRR